MTNNVIVEAGVGGALVLGGEPSSIATAFPDERVSRLSIEARPQEVHDLRVTLWITIEFELDSAEESELTNISWELLDRVVDVLAVSAGQEVRIYHWQTTIRLPNGGMRTILRPIGINAQPPTVFDPTPLITAEFTERHYRALRHLRHGLAHTAPDRRFASLMLAIIILARFFVPDISKVKTCRQCGAEVERHGPGDRDYMLNLAEVLESWTVEKLDYLWTQRNNLTGHGNRAMDTRASMSLLEASFDAVRLAYDCLRASLPNVNLAGPTPLWFMTDLDLLMTIADRAHETAVDIAIRQEPSGEWTASWPAGETVSFATDLPGPAIARAADAAQRSMKRPIRGSSGPPTVVRVNILI